MTEINQPKYLHGFSKLEQDRLYKQAKFFEPWIYQDIKFQKSKNILEVGSGVGAQTEIILKHFPKSKVTCVDFSADQLNRAKHHLQKQAKKERVEFHQGDARHLPFKNKSFDGAFLCWFLEHLESPIEVLKEVRRTLRPASPIYLTEVLNSSFYVHPYSPATLKYWFEFNDHQWNLKGDPFVGAKLANYLLEAGYKKVKTEIVVHHFDNRNPKLRAQCIEDWTNMLLSAAPKLLELKKVSIADVQAMKVELETLKCTEGSVFFSTFVKANAVS
ncbi:MAG: methyltransferase domain-containing protein [Deltaproteobacteria bacterium]|nr:methyltransferase domain-containing protein [Deltaproteobacteria bacterium]